MPSLTRKVIKGRSYYDLRHCQRMDGRPKIVKTTYLGSTEQVLARLATPALRPQPRAVEIATLGDVAALYDVAHQLDLVALIDAHLPKREQGLSVGQYLLLATLNRAAHPTSKAGLADWYQRTVLPRLVPASPGQLSSQAFWNHMERVTQGCAHITLIFDKGNNSHEAFENLDDSGFHFVGSLVSTQHPDLLAIPQRRFRPLQDARLEECRTYRTTKVVFGVERTVLVTHNENLLVGQLQGIAANLTKARGKLRALQQQL